jgi:hypothetical protein
MPAHCPSFVPNSVASRACKGQGASQVFTFKIVPCLYFSLRIGEQTYCGDYETVVLDEIKDLASCDGKDVEAALDKSKKKVILYTPQNRRLKGRIVPMIQCSTGTLAQSINR